MIFQVYRCDRNERDRLRYRLIGEVGADDARAAHNLALMLWPQQLHNPDPERYRLGVCVVRPFGDVTGMPGFKPRKKKS